MNTKLLLGLALVLSAGWFALTPAAAMAQSLPGFDFGLRQPGITNLFSRPFAGTADIEVRQGDSTVNLTMGLCADDDKVRMYLDLSKASGGVFAPQNIAIVKQLGQDKLISIDRPDEHKTFEIYPGRHAYIEHVTATNAAADADPQPLKTLLGVETIDGHPCQKFQLTFPTNAGVAGKVWEASDLKGFPLQMEFSNTDGRVKIHYQDVKLGPQDPSLFEVPKGYTRYDSPDEMIFGKRAAAKTPESKADVDARVLKSNRELADKGDAYGELRMGLRYRNGEGVPEDLDKAREWLQKAADQGDSDAAIALAKLPKSQTPGVSAPTNSVSVDADLVVVSAEFGTGKKVADVTARVGELLRSQPDDGFATDVKALGADPLPGKKKRLTIHYRYLGADYTFINPVGKQVSRQALVDNALKKP